METTAKSWLNGSVLGPLLRTLVLPVSPGHIAGLLYGKAVTYQTLYVV